MPKKGERTWTDEQLRAAVASSSTFLDVIRKLALSPAGRNFYHIKAHIERLTLDTSHFTPARAINNYDVELRELVPRSSTMRELLEKLGLGEPARQSARAQHGTLRPCDQAIRAAPELDGRGASHSDRVVTWAGRDAARTRIGSRRRQLRHAATEDPRARDRYVALHGKALEQGAGVSTEPTPSARRCARRRSLDRIAPSQASLDP
jgi:hypothetical protein